MEQMPIIKVWQLILKKTPPIIGVIYSKEGDTNKYYHNVNIHIDKASSPEEIVDELQREETVYFGKHLMKKEQLIKLTSQLFESPTKSDDSSGKKKKSLRDRLNLPIHEEKAGKKEAANEIEENQANSDRGQNDIAIIDQDYDPSKHNLQRVFIEDAGQEFLMDSTGNLFDMEGNCVGKAQYEDDDNAK
jgi:hypothetical protein